MELPRRKAGRISRAVPQATPIPAYPIRGPQDRAGLGEPRGHRVLQVDPAINMPDCRLYLKLMLTMQTDPLAEVIARAQRREPQAFDQLLEAYGARLYGYFYRLCGSRHEAEDLLQETFVRLVRRIDQYQHDGHFEAWLFRIATNLVRDRLRRLRRRHEVQPDGEIGENGESGMLEASKESQPDSQLSLQEEIDRLQGALARLSEEEREVIILRHFSQLSFREIAELMGTPLGTALARAHRGLRRLRQLMEDSDA